MAALLATGLLLLQLHGQMTYYDPGKMEEVFANRVRWGQVEECPFCVGMLTIDTKYQQYIGELAYIDPPGFPMIGPLLIVDCGGFQTYGRVAEVNYQLAKKLNMRGPLNAVDIYIVARDAKPTQSTLHDSPKHPGRVTPTPDFNAECVSPRLSGARCDDF